MKNELLKLPKHIAFIIDGNGRWAKKRGFVRSRGHYVGMKKLEVIIQECFYKYNIPVVSIYAFSTENWNRPKEEVDYLMKLFRNYLKTNDFVEKYPNTRLNIMGDYTKFPDDLVEVIENTLEKTKNNTGYILNLGINYGGKDEIVNAVNNIITDKVEKVDKEIIESYLYTKNQPPLDFVIRTSGEQRISNFMLWQIAYAELYFTETYWPAFGKTHLYKALIDYQKRDRRFGSIKK